MTDSSKRTNDPTSDSFLTYESLASQALSSVAQRTTTFQSSSHKRVIEVLAEIYVSTDAEERRSAVANLIDSGVSPEQFVTVHAKETAQLLGTLWADNKLSFVDVTIGVARLQETVRSMTQRQSSHFDLDAPEVLLAAPVQEDHVFGLFVVSEEFRKMGCVVQLALGYNREELRKLVSDSRFDLVGLSVSSRRNILHAKELVDTLRSGARSGTKVAIGGGATTFQDIDLLEATGADVVTSDPVEALEKTGLSKRIRSLGEPILKGGLLPVESNS